MDLHDYDRARRRLIAVMLGTGMTKWACSQNTTSATMNTTPTTTSLVVGSDAELKHRFRGVGGGERRIDALVRMDGVALYDEKGYVIETGSFSPTICKTSAYGSGDFVMPKTIRMMYHGEEASKHPSPNINWQRTPPAYAGTPITDVTVEVAARIPVEVLDEVRRGGGGLRLKIRLYPEGILIGWDIERRPTYSKGSRIYAPPLYLLAGGDFRERHYDSFIKTKLGWVQNSAGEVDVKGWYIDPKTGQKIETDF